MQWFQKDVPSEDGDLEILRWDEEEGLRGHGSGQIKTLSRKKLK